MVGRCRNDRPRGLILAAVVSCLIFSCSDGAKDSSIDLPVAENGWSVSGLRLHVSVLKDRHQFLVNDKTCQGISSVVKALTDRGEKYTRLSFNLPADFPAREYIQIITQFRIESVREINPWVLCRFSKEYDKGSGHCSLPKFVAQEDAHPHCVHTEDTPRLKIGMDGFERDGKIRRSLSVLRDELLLTLEVARLTDSKPIVLLTVSNDVDLQRLVETFDFNEAQDLIMLVAE